MSPCLPRPCCRISTASLCRYYNCFSQWHIYQAIASSSAQANWATRPNPFKMLHTAETFLPPVINSTTGTEQTFVYMPQGHQVPPKSPRYGRWEITDLLVKQHPPLFHAATDIHSSVRAFSSMPNLRHHRINCEGQIPSHRYRRSIVEYALISLRMAVEQAPLRLLDRLSLLSIHPAAVLYLQPNLGFGVSSAPVSVGPEYTI